MASMFSLRRLFGFDRPALTISNLVRPFTTTTPSLMPRALATVKRPNKGKGGGKLPLKSKAVAPKRKKRNVGRSDAYARVKVLRMNLFSPAPPPLRMARLRHLRHWTIHRAWMLFRRRQREGTERERQRINAGMWNACEELRLTAGPDSRGEGYLYRVAMEKKGVWGTSGVPIEYARFQTEYPATNAWDHDWKR